jgi:eukaryotic-like serine/threonine-protein kinase
LPSERIPSRAADTGEPLLIGQSLAHYRIIAAIGAGGMGEVYRATDTRLHRDVALKVLPPEMAASAELIQRFQREARAVAALNHPHVVTIYSVEEADGVHFLTMELVDGEPLSRLIPPGGMAVSRLLRIAAGLADALAAAHDKNIIHRDLKPANVMVTTAERVKVLDFGLAKMGAPDDSPPGLADEQTDLRTRDGVVMGTMPYMSPEQLHGYALDHRTDIFSLGVMLYEMASGVRPFGGESSIALASAILRDPPSPLAERRKELPQGLIRIITRCLEKNADDRFSSARDVYNALTGVSGDGDAAPATLVKATVARSLTSTTAASAARNSIAVLPFTNMSRDEDNEYFCDGLAEELLNALSKIDHLKVAARTSAFSFRGRNASVSEIGEKLGVNTVFEGSVRKSGNRLRISVQLIDVATGFRLWSERYDRELADIFDVQDEIALAVVEALKVTLFADEKAAVLKRYTEDAEVHEWFLKGRYHANKYTAEGWKRAIEAFEKAIERQPDHAPSSAGIAISLGCLWFFGMLPAEETIPQCKAAILKALEIDGALPDAYLALAMITFLHDWEWEKAGAEFERSISLNPNNPEVLSYYAMYLAFQERFEDAISRSKRSLELDPLSPLINMNVGWTYFSAGMLDEASSQATRMIEIEPDFFGSYWLKGAIHLTEGQYENAVEELEKAVSLGGRQIVMADLGSAYSLAGKSELAAAALDQLLEMRQREYVPAICVARMYACMEETEKAIEWFEKAFQERNGEMVFLQKELAGAAEGDSLNSLTHDPRVADLFRRMNLPGLQTEVRG